MKRYGCCCIRKQLSLLALVWMIIFTWLVYYQMSSHPTPLFDQFPLVSIHRPSKKFWKSASITDGCSGNQTGDLPSYVLLVGQNRGGSSFGGEVFNQNPDAFYWFEPLIAPFDVVYGPWAHDAATIWTNESFWVDFDETARQLTLDIIPQILTCRLEQLPSVVYQHRIMVDPGPRHMAAYRTCIQSYKRVKMERPPEPYRNQVRQAPYPDYVQACLPQLKAACCQANIRAVKTIRLSAKMVDAVLSRLPQINVIVYTRDPRGVLASRKRSGTPPRHLYTDQLSEGARALCQLMRRDRIGYEQLKESGYSLNWIRYEDLARHSVETIGRVYDFLEVHKPSIQTIQGVVKLTRSIKDGGALDTFRHNSTNTSWRWRTELSQSHIQNITATCLDVLQMYGYPVNTL